MMSWINEYKDKLVSPDEAVSVVQSGDRIFISGNAATPFALLRSLALRKDELKDVEVTHVLLIGEDPLSATDMEGHFRHNSLFVGPADRKAVNEGRADYIPIFLFQIPGLFLKGLMPLDKAIVHLSPPDDHGFMSLGVETLASKTAVETAGMVIAQVNDRMPRSLGDCFIHVSRVQRIAEVSEDLPELQKKEATEVEKKIGENVAALIDDGSTLQLGIGGIPDAVLASLDGKRDLGVHSEMVSDGVVEAIEKGIITGARKTLHPGKVIVTFLLGSRNLYDYVHNNPEFECHPVHYTNHPFVISQNEKMVAINSAIEVDLTGQVCSDSIGPRIYSGFGGQVDFIRGAAHAERGKPIIAIPATARGGQESRIVPFLKKGAGVVTSRGDVHYVVTEYGVAYLHGKNLKERAKALIAIAHPDFKDFLIKGAEERDLL